MMAESPFATQQYTSEEFVESAGAILFHISSQRVCLLRWKGRNEWLLAKGRRDTAESRSDAAIREVIEETGYSCRLLASNLRTRATLAGTHADVSDAAQACHGNKEPFMLTLRSIGPGNMKLIWWYLAAIDEEKEHLHRPPEDKFEVRLFSFEDALSLLTYQLDRDVLTRAIDLLSDRT